MKELKANDIAKDERAAKILAAAAKRAQNIPGETCEQEEWLFLYLNNALSKKQREWIENHLAACEYCRTTVEAAGKYTSVRKDFGYYFNISSKVTLSTLKFIKRPLVVVPVVAVLCFIAYNTFVMDYAAVNQRLVLSGYDSAKTMEEAYAYSPLIRAELGRKVAAGTLNSETFGGLTVADSMLSSGFGEVQLGETRYILKKQYQAEVKKRGVLTLSDIFTAGISDSTPLLESASFLVKKIWADTPKNDRANETLQLAYATDKSGESDKAVGFYLEYVKEAGLKEGSQEWRTIKLREACCRLKIFDKTGAYSIYNAVESAGGEEKILCSRMKSYIKRAEKEMERGGLLFLEAEKEQEAALKLEKLLLSAKSYMYAMEYEKAASVYEKLMAIMPNDEVCFALAWCRKNTGDFTEAKRLLASVKTFNDAVLLESANINEREETFETAAEEYSELAKTSKNKELATMAQFKAGCVYLYNAGRPYYAENTFEALSKFENKDYRKYYDLKLVTALQKEKMHYISKGGNKGKKNNSGKDNFINEKLPAQRK